MREPKKQKRCLNCIDRRIALMRKKRYLLKPLRSFTPDGSIAFENAVMNALSFDSKDRTQTMEKMIEELTAAKPAKRHDTAWKKEHPIRIFLQGG